MKTFSFIFLSIVTIGTFPAVGHEHQPMHPNIEQRLNQIDSSLLLRQYEQLKMHAFETRMKLDLLDLEPHHDSKESKQKREWLSKRAKTLESQADEIRKKAIVMTTRARDERRRQEVTRQVNQKDQTSAKQAEKKSGCKKSECKSKKEN